MAGVNLDATAESYQKIRDRVLRLEPGDPLTIQVLRGGKVVELSRPFGEFRKP